ncbi:MAG: LTA synthase family protein [Solirubrobacterales bacterium]
MCRGADIIVFAYIIGAKILFYGKQISPDYFSITSLKGPIIASLLPIIGITILLKENKRVKALFFINLIISIVLFADNAYYRYFKDIISVGAIRNGIMLGGVSSCVKTLIKPTDLIYIADLLFIFPLVRFISKNKGNRLNGLVRFTIFLIFFSSGIMMDARYIKELAAEQPLLISTMSNKLYVTKILGNINFHAIDLFNYANNAIESKKSVSTETKQEIKSYLQGNNSSSSGTVLKGAGVGKNLIMIQVEALQQFVINKKINGVEITPNLNKWINKSMYFDNYFYQVSSGNTSDAEFMSLNSLYPADSGAAYYRYTEDTLDTLPIELGSKGYTTSALHGYTESFWNRNIMYKTEGFQTFYGGSSFNNDEEVGMGLSDKSFLTQSLAKVEAQKQPYYSFLITLSSHYPFNDTAGYGDFNTGEYEGTLMGNYLKGIHYTDQQLGMFLDQLEKDGTLDNSIVVLYGDHNAIPKEYIDQLYKLENINSATDLDWYELQKVPMLIHFSKDANKGVNHTYSGQMDLYPTIANLFDINLKYSFGKDILNPSSQNVIFRNGSFTDGSIFYVSWTDTYYDIGTKNIISETDELKRKKEAALTELNYSDNILNHNLIKSGIAK